MVPFCTTATRPGPLRCGWALRSSGLPWVAQRVWPMPQWPAAQLPLSIHRGDACRVIATGFKLTQTLQQQEGRFSRSDHRNDPAHEVLSAISAMTGRTQSFRTQGRGAKRLHSQRTTTSRADRQLMDQGSFPAKTQAEASDLYHSAESRSHGKGHFEPSVRIATKTGQRDLNTSPHSCSIE
jgi:hypothetical protein